MQQLTQRQQTVLDLISERESVSNSEIAEFLGYKISRFSILRDLEHLNKNGLVLKKGQGRSVRYILSSKGRIDRFIQPDIYFSKGPDERKAKTVFNPSIIDELPNLISDKEHQELLDYNQKYLDSISKMGSSSLKKEIERLAIELSWKSSRIEGNTYSLIDTEVLIKERIEARGRKRGESLMILNHKGAIDHIFLHKDKYQEINLSQIKELHRILLSGLETSSEIREDRVGIVGTRYTPPLGRIDIFAALDRAINQINSLASPFSRALGLILMISYIQPFSDGNKRTSRIIGNAILLAHNICPLSYRGVDEADYKKAMILFYEQNSARFFKELFIEQFKFAVDNYF